MGSVSRNIIVVAATAIFLAAATAAALTLGASSVSLPELAAWLVGGDVSDMARNILENVRVPRVLAALLAGAALATSGALIQACLDNPLASPNVIGVNSGAGLAVRSFPGRCGSRRWRPLSGRWRRRSSSLRCRWARA